MLLNKIKKKIAKINNWNCAKISRNSEKCENLKGRNNAVTRQGTTLDFIVICLALEKAKRFCC